MTSVILLNRSGRPTQGRLPSTRGPMFMTGQMVLSQQRLSTDSIGSFVLTLTNVVVGSAVQVETQAGAVVNNRTAAASTVTITVPAYAVGNANNSLRIKVRKASASPYFIPFETQATAFVGAQSVYVSQIPDE